MKEWICNEHICGFTPGRIYSTSPEGSLIDNAGDLRLRPENYNYAIKGAFKQIEDVSLENK